MARYVRDLRDYYRAAGLRGLLCAARSRRDSPPKEYEIHKPWLAHPFWLRLPSSDVPTYKQVFVDREYAFEVSKPPQVIVDAGANIGLASLYFANRFPKAAIFAIEAESTNFDLLKKNVAPYSTIHPIHRAIWNENIEIDLVDPGLGNWGFQTRLSDSGQPALPCHRVQGITIDRLMHEQSISLIDILKIDIEGAEHEVFLKPSAWLDKVGAMVIELHEKYRAGSSRSFRAIAEQFDHQWTQGENLYLSRRDSCLIPKASRDSV